MNNKTDPTGSGTLSKHFLYEKSHKALLLRLYTTRLLKIYTESNPHHSSSILQDHQLLFSHLTYEGSIFFKSPTPKFAASIEISLFKILIALATPSVP